MDLTEEGFKMKIEVCHVEKSLKGREVLKDISCVMESGKIYGLYGHNGSGKTMLMRCILGLIHIDHGNIIIDGEKLGKDIDFPQSVGAIIENPIFFPYATGFENLKILADIKGMIGEKEIREVLRKVGLDDQDNRTVSKYSLGMRQRLAIAQAVMEKPQLLVLDEPTNALDEDGIIMFKKIIMEEVKRGALIILASHHREDIDQLSDVRIKLSDGKIVEEREK